MPPKKQEEQNLAPYIVWNILPIFCGATSAIDSLRKPVNIKKTLQLSKIIEILKEKGIQKYINEGVLNQQGYLFASQNLQHAANQYINQLRKPVDPKKDQKKDTKKDSKKEQPPQEEVEKTIQFNFQKSVNEFLVFLDFPKDNKSLKTAVESGWKVDVLVLVQQKVKQSSRLPNYDLLNKQRTIDDFLKEINSTAPASTQNYKASNAQKAKLLQFVSQFKKLRVSKAAQLQNTIIIQIPYLRDLQHPQNDPTQFLSSFFKKISELTLNRSRFQTWKKEQKISPMVPPIKQKIKRQVIVQQKKEEKKGSKKDPNQPPQTEIIQEIIQKRYEDLPGNAKSDLSQFKRISKHRNTGANIYQIILDNLALSISQQTEKEVQVEKVNIAQIGSKFINKSKNNPTNKVTITALADRLPKVINSLDSAYLQHKSTLHPSLSLCPQVSLNALLKQSPLNRSLQFQYKMQLLNRSLKGLQSKLSYSFQDRIFVQKLSQSILNSRINQQLQLQPKVYLAQSQVDSFRLLILARVNPPGRIFYQNSIFDWKVLPNFQFWQKYFKDIDCKDKHFWNYDWKNNGNLKVLTKKLMPTDNMIITESVYISGDSQHKILTLQKDAINYAFKTIHGINVFSKHSQELHLDAFAHSNHIDHSCQTFLNIAKEDFTVFFEEKPTIFWKKHPTESKRQFGQQGQVIKYMKNGLITVLYPNGNFSQYEYGQWKHIRNNSKREQSKVTEMKVINRADGDKKISVREDETTFVEYSNGDQLVLFKDGTKFTHFKATNTIQILNECGIIIRKIFPRSKDFNVIGSGSAFAFLGEKNILQRSFDGALFQLHHPSFTWHSYTECVDRAGNLSKELVKMVTFRDGGILKINHLGLLTFLHGSDNHDSDYAHERWLQLFTNPQYHGQGVYDVDLIGGALSTKDKESNIFKLSLHGQSDIKIAVSFNIGSSAQDTNNYGNGFHVPQQNYFLPPPENYVTPRLFIIYSDGTGEQFLTEKQVEELKGFTKNRIGSGSQNYLQLIKQNNNLDSYYSNSFTTVINPNKFTLPLLLNEQPKTINLIPSHFHDILFINLQEMNWDRQYKTLNEYRHKIQQQRRSHNEQLQRLRKKIS